MLVDKARGGFVEHLSQASAGQQSVTIFITMVVMNLATPKAAVSFCATNRPQESTPEWST